MTEIKNTLAERDPSFSDVNISESEEPLEEIFLSDVYASKNVLQNRNTIQL